MGWPEVTLLMTCIIGISAPLTAKFLSARKVAYTEAGDKCATKDDTEDILKAQAAHDSKNEVAFHRLSTAMQQLCNSTAILVDRQNRHP